MSFHNTFFNPLSDLVDNILVVFVLLTAFIFSLFIVLFIASFIVVFVTIFIVQSFNLQLSPATIIVTAFSLYQYTVDVVANLTVLAIDFILFILNSVITILHAFNLFLGLTPYDVTGFQTNGVIAIKQILDYPYQYISQIYGVPYQVIF